jgi:hypothetical protein
MTVQHKRLLIILLSVPLLLLIPLIAMQFTTEVDWSILDFLVMGVLLSSAGLICDLILRKVKKDNHRIVFLVAIVVTFLLIWAELGVGIFGTPFAGS